MQERRVPLFDILPGQILLLEMTEAVILDENGYNVIH